jgi:hypothetical protein
MNINKNNNLLILKININKIINNNNQIIKIIKDKI